MSEYKTSATSKVVRGHKRAHYDHKTIHGILDSHFICHIPYIFENTPITIPTGYGRDGDTIYLHGAVKNRMLLSLLKQEKVSLTVTHTDGFVLARSVFHHSFNYRSAIIFGKPRLVANDKEKMRALHIITENILPGRWDEARIPNSKELRSTAVVAIDIQEASAKMRTGGPLDDDEDYSLDVWAGVLPIESHLGTPVPDDRLKENIELPESTVWRKL